MEGEPLESGSGESSLGLRECRSSLSDFPNVDVIWNRASVGRAEILTPTPSGDGPVDWLQDVVREPKRYASYKENEIAAWRCICGLEGFIGHWEEGHVKPTAELIHMAATNAREFITTDPEKFEYRLKSLTKAIQSPNAFHQRSLERMLTLVLGAGIGLDKEADAIETAYAQTVTRMKVCAGLLGTVVFVGIGYLVHTLWQ